MRNTVENLLRRFPEDEHDLPFCLLKEGPARMEALFGKRTSRCTLHRWATKGVVGERLETVSPGAEMRCTLRMLAEFSVRVAAARAAVSTKQDPPTRDALDEEEAAVLRRHRARRREARG